MRVWKAVSIMAVSAACHVSSPGISAAASCVVCDTGLNCASADQGARFCVQSPMTCALAIPCIGGGPRRESDPTEEQLVTWSLFEVDGGGGGAIGTEHGAGLLAVGEAMRPAGAGRGPLVDAALAFGTDLAVILAHAAGDGFAVRRTGAGAQARIEVLEVAGARPGRVLADAMLGERDRLRVRVHAGGRECLLVLQAVTMPAVAVHGVVTRLRASLREAAGSLPPRTAPLFEVRGL
jgi:hypothetical protein